MDSLYANSPRVIFSQAMNTMLDKELRKVLIFLSDDEKEWLSERSAILEYEAGMPREEAEKAAYRMTAAEFGFRDLLEK